MVKYNQNLSNYDYVLSFDLAKQKTGWAVVDIKSNRIQTCGMIVTDDKSDSVWLDLYEKIVDVLKNVQKFCNEENKRFFVLKEKLPNQAGKFTTIASLQALAYAHAVWEIACGNCSAEVYDFEGIHSVSVKAFFKRKYGVEKPQKEDIAKFVCEYYDFHIGERTLDITDAIACVQTLVEYKWNEDIKDKIKELKKEQKKYKTDKKKKQIAEEIQRLEKMEV